MPQSLAQIYVHLVFSTKGRAPWVPLDLTSRLSSYMAGILQELRCPSLQVNTVQDHTHLLFLLGKRCDIAEVVERVKTGSSKWVKRETGNRHFFWQNGYGAFSVSASHLDPVIDYIRTQQEHHATVSFQDEFRRLLTRNKVEYEKRDVWD